MTAEERAHLEALMAAGDTPVVSFDRPRWMKDGACLEHPEVEFVPPNARTEESAVAARAICAGCLVRGPCLAFALADASLLGVWAGMTTSERRTMRRQARQERRRAS